MSRKPPNASNAREKSDTRLAERIQILLDHQRNFENDGVIKFTQIKAGDLFDLFQAVNKGIAVDIQLSGCFGHIQIVLKKPVNRLQGVIIQRLIGFFLKTSLRNISHSLVGSW